MVGVLFVKYILMYSDVNVYVVIVEYHDSSRASFLKEMKKTM